MRDQFQKWLQTAKIWYDSRSSLQSYLPEDEELSDLVEFLRQLSEALESALCVRNAVESFPETGQFLGRLSALPCLLAISNIYKYYLRCLLALYTETPNGEIETKASSWAMSQIQYSFKSDGSNLKQIQNSLIESLCCGRSSKIQASITASDSLLGTCGLCLRLLHVPECASTLNELMHYLIYLKTSPQLTTFLHKASQVQLPYDSQVALYRMNLSDLERDVHSAVVSSMKELNKQQFIQHMNQHHFIRAAAENPCIFIAIEYWLRGMCVKSGMHYTWAFITLWFLDAASRHSAKPNLVSFKPPIFTISGSSLSCVKAHVKSISELLRMEASIYSDHPAFYTVLHHAALFLCLISTDESRRSCIHVLLFRYSDLELKYKEQMQEFVAGLGCLLLKSQVEMTAVQCCWGPMMCYDASDESAVMCRLIAQQLLLVFLLLAPLRMDVSEFILEKATGSSNATDCLESLIDTVIIALSLEAPWIQLQTNHILCLLNSLWESVQKELPYLTCITDNVYEEHPLLVDNRFKLLDSSLQSVRKRITQSSYS